MNPLTLLARCAQTAVRPATGLFERLSASVRCGRLAAVVILAVAGCQPFTGYRLPWSSLKPRSQSPDADDTEIDNEFQTRVRTPMIGDYTTFAGLNLISLEGVGLVTGLDNTGGDPPPSMYRTELIEAMKKRGVNNPNMVLRSPTTALVVVRAYLPPLVRK
jgi:hypothetical protein